MTRDLTALLVRQGEHTAQSIETAVRAGAYGDVWLRIRPLDSLGLLQVELFDALGRPCIDPALVHALSQGGRRSVMVHVNHTAGQALVHAFHGGEERLAWMGAPGELDARLEATLGRKLAELVQADDGSRVGIGLAASATRALVRGYQLAVPVGTLMAMDCFRFHDRGVDLDGSDRVALVAYDGQRVVEQWRSLPGRELAARLEAVPDVVLGPLRGQRADAVSALAALGEQTAAQGALRSLPAFELLVLSEAYLLGSGEPVAYLDHRFLPLLSLSDGTPRFDEGEAEALAQAPSVLAAMVEILPYSSPDGSLLAQLGDDEVGPLAPWVNAGEEYSGSLFALRSPRLERLFEVTDVRRLEARAAEFYQHWWEARTDCRADEGFDAWRQQFEQRGAPDIERFLRNWAEWRSILGLARHNRLDTALWFYAA